MLLKNAGCEIKLHPHTSKPVNGCLWCGTATAPPLPLWSSLAYGLVCAIIQIQRSESSAQIAGNVCHSQCHRQAFTILSCAVPTVPDLGWFPYSPTGRGLARFPCIHPTATSRSYHGVPYRWCRRGSRSKTESHGYRSEAREVWDTSARRRGRRSPIRKWSVSETLRPEGSLGMP